MSVRATKPAKTTIEGAIPRYEQMANEHAIKLRQHFAQLSEAGVNTKIVILSNGSRISLDNAMDHQAFVASNFILEAGNPVELSLESNNPESLRRGVELTKQNLVGVLLDESGHSAIED